MEKKKWRVLPVVLMALGALLITAALYMLDRTPQVLQSAVAAPEPGEENVNYVRQTPAARAALGALADGVSAGAVGGVKAEVSLSAGDRSQTATLFAMGEGWLEVSPRFLKEGRRISETELAEGARRIMLDEALAFQLFGTVLPEDATVTLNGADYAVVGTVRHAGSLFGGRGVGDIQPYDCYIPLAALPEGLRLDTLTLSAKPLDASGAAQLFGDTAAGSWQAGGTLINLPKEAMRRTILARVLALIAGVYALIGLSRAMAARFGRAFARFRQALAQRYIGALLPRLIALLLLMLLSFGALAGLAWLLLTFSAQPLYVFTEWVPDNIVAWSSLTKVFWNLTKDAAALVRVGTRELLVTAFWGGALRWGVMLLLTGAALRGARRDYN